jgi:hypothetical protein
MPVAWVGLPATTTTHAWRRLGRRRRPALPHGEQGLVVTERGL